MGRKQWEERVYEVAKASSRRPIAQVIAAIQKGETYICSSGVRDGAWGAIDRARVAVLDEQAAEIARLKEEARVLDMTRVSCSLCGWTGVVRDLRTSKHGHCPKCGEHL